MKRLKDITKDQVIEIAKLIYPFFNDLATDYTFHYQPYDELWFEDAREFVRLRFRGFVFGDKIEDLMIEINKNLDCWFYYIRDDGTHHLPSKNQCAVQRKFIEWGLEPDYSKS